MSEQINKRSVGYVIKISDEAKERINNRSCPACGKHKDLWSRRKDWTCCSEECTKKFNKDMLIRSWPELRDKAIERDGFKCRMCGYQPIRKIRYQIYQDNYWNKILIGKDGDEFLIVNTSQFIGDHIIPIALGGEEWDINNVQTLCLTCNKIKTKQDIQKIAALRKRIKLQTEKLT